MGLFRRSQDQAHPAWIDRLGVTASVGCAIHCALTGLVFLALPGVFQFSHEFTTDWTHWVMAGLVIPVALYSIGRGYRVHRKNSTLLFGSLGLVMITAGLIAHPDPSEVALTFLGGIFLALAHFINLKGIKFT